jgi:hypothetical protein
MREHGRAAAVTLDVSNLGNPNGSNLSTPAWNCLFEAGEWISPARSQVSKEFIEALAPGRPTSLDLTVGLKHISCCPHCAERLDVEAKLIGLIRSAWAYQVRIDGVSGQGNLLIVNAGSESKD